MADSSKALSGWQRRIENKIDTLCELLTGDGDPSKGLTVRVALLEKGPGPELTVRVALLEQQAKRTSRIQWGVLTVVVPAVITAVINLVWWVMQ